MFDEMYKSQKEMREWSTNNEMYKKRARNKLNFPSRARFEEMFNFEVLRTVLENKDDIDTEHPRTSKLELFRMVLSERLRRVSRSRTKVDP